MSGTRFCKKCCKILDESNFGAFKTCRDCREKRKEFYNSQSSNPEHLHRIEDKQVPQILFSETSAIAKFGDNMFCGKCNGHGLKLTKIKEGEGFGVSFTFSCSCGWNYIWENEALRCGDSPTKKSSWLSTTILHSFILSGKLFSDFDHIFNLMGVKHSCESLFFKTVVEMDETISEMLEENMKEEREEVQSRGIILIGNVSPMDFIITEAIIPTTLQQVCMTFRMAKSFFERISSGPEKGATSKGHQRVWRER